MKKTKTVLIYLLTSAFLLTSAVPVYADEAELSEELFESVAEPDELQADILLNDEISESEEPDPDLTTEPGTDEITGIDIPGDSHIILEHKPALAGLLEELPRTITVYRGDYSETIDAVWVCDADYDELLGDYPFVPDLGGRAVAEGLEIPCITVSILNEEGGPVGGDLEVDPGYEIPSVGSGGLRKVANLPAAYNVYERRELPVVRGQSPYGACWSFSTAGLLEADRIHDGAGTDIDLSELQQVYFNNKSLEDPLKYRTDKVEKVGTLASGWLDNGGSVLAASMTLANLMGAIPETVLPYSDVIGLSSQELDSYSLPDSLAVSRDVVQLRNAYYINISDVSDMKNAIMEHGAVGISYYDTKKSTEYSATHNSYYYTGTGHNHAVMLVGWDDDFPADDFVQKPKGNGAWLVRNSWGYNGYGHDGYFWLSYYDGGMNSTEYAVAFDASDETYDNCYAYDAYPIGNANLNFSGQATVVTDFEVLEGEIIKAVAFDTGSPNLTVSVTLTNTSTGQSVSASRTTTYAGIYTAEFDTPLEITENATVNVSVKFTAENNGNIKVLLEPVKTKSFGSYVQYTGVCDRGCEVNGKYRNYDPRVKLYTDYINPPSPGEETVTGVRVTPESAEITLGETYALTATVLPTYVTQKDVTWKSNDPKIATVSDAGVVTGIKTGTTVITATSVNGNKSDSCTVTVKPKAVTGVEISSTREEISVGGTVTLSAKVLPEDATNKNITWKSTNTAVATVSQEGVVKGLEPGTAEISVTTEDGGFSDTCFVTVEPIPVTGVSLDRENASVTKGEKITLKATVLPENATYKTVTWESSDEGVATVSDTGVVKGINPGITVITVETVDGWLIAECVVTVKPIAVKGVKLNKTKANILIGKTVTLTATVTPSDATNKNVTWTSSNKKVATVSKKGVVTGKKPGTVTITAKTEDGKKKATCKITVKPISVKSVKLKRKKASIVKGKKLTLKYSVSPSNATNKNVTWKSSNKKVATVSKKGVVTGKNPGTATITVTTKDGKKKATCKITVKKPVKVKKVGFGKKEYSVKKGKKLQLEPVFLPKNTTETKLAWKSFNTKIATVNGKGEVKGLKKGKTAIVAATPYTGIYAVCIVTVK